MSDTVRILAAKSDIADLVHTYALNIRRGHPYLCEALFTSDATFEVRECDPIDQTANRQRYIKIGRDDVVASIGSSGSAVRVFPQIHNLIIAVDGDLASATSLMIGKRLPGGGETLGDYQDRFRCEDGKWLFTARIYTIYASS